MIRILLWLMTSRYKRSGKTMLATQHTTNKSIRPKRPFTSNTMEGTEVYSIEREDSDIHVCYLHGGAYVHYGDPLHFRFLKTLSNRAKVSVHYIDYPLAPESTYETTTKRTIQVIQTIQQDRQGRFFIMGDSSGGGLALAISNQLEHIDGYILMSPWVDVSLSNPDLKSEDYTDGFYTKEELQECGRLYAQEDVLSPLASPLYLNSLPDVPIIVFNGTADLLGPDVKRMEAKHPSITVHEYRNAPHVFPLIPFSKEQTHVIKTFQSLLNNN